MPQSPEAGEPHPEPTTALQRRDPALDGLRGVAVLLVFLFHYGGGLRATHPALRLMGHLAQAGWAGVELFFALSGYLITAQLMADAAGSQAHSRADHLLRNFYLRRALRILPLYYTALLACALGALWAGATGLQLRPLLAYVFFLQNTPPLVDQALHTPSPLPVYHLWTLAVEAQFYLLWPLLLLPLRRRSGVWLAVTLFVLGCLLRALLFTTPFLGHTMADHMAVFLPTRSGALALGCALALVLSTRNAHHLRAAAFAVLLLTAALWLLLGSRSGGFLLQGRLAFICTLPVVDLLAAATVALCLLPGTGFRVALAWRPLVLLGRISYGFYVLHLLCQPLFDKLGTLLTHQSHGFAYQGARLLVALPTSVLLATLSYRFLELPFLRLKRWVPLRRSPVLASVGPSLRST